MQREREGAVVRQGHLIALVRAFLIGCFVLLLVVGCAGTRSESSKKEQGSSPQATDSEEARCEGTRTYHFYFVDYTDEPLLNGSVRSGSEKDIKKADKEAGQRADDLGVFTTNDLPSCPNKGGLLSGTDERDKLDGAKGDDEIRGLGDTDLLEGGPGSDTIYGGDGYDYLDSLDMFQEGSYGEDVLYGGDGEDKLAARDGQRDKLYCGHGKDFYIADKIDYVDSSCEKKVDRFGGGA